MASQSTSTSVGVGSSNEPTIVEVLETTRNKDIWQHYDLCKMSDGSKKGRCKQCGKFIRASSNSTLRQHIEKPYCPVRKVIPDGGQSSMSREGGLFAYEADRVRQQFAGFVIQQGLPFNHFDNPRLTNIIQKCLQPRYTHVSRATLRRDALRMWKKAKLELINGFEKLNTSVNLTTDVWSAPHGLPGSYLCVTAHWIDPTTWQMMKRTIDFENFDYPHTGDNLFH
nr:zinc finger BED domain-containing protein DAYSLEEPER [Tanacetum cinerariifolium]